VIAIGRDIFGLKGSPASRKACHDGNVEKIGFPMPIPMKR
jgi:hypothetical protein